MRQRRACVIFLLVGLLGAAILAPSGQGASERRAATGRGGDANPPGARRERSVLLGEGRVHGHRYRVVATSSPNTDNGEPCIFLKVVGLGGAARGGGELGDCLIEHYHRALRHALLPVTYGGRRKLQ